MASWVGLHAECQRLRCRIVALGDDRLLAKWNALSRRYPRTTPVFRVVQRDATPVVFLLTAPHAVSTPRRPNAGDRASSTALALWQEAIPVGTVVSLRSTTPRTRVDLNRFRHESHAFVQQYLASLDTYSNQTLWVNDIHSFPDNDRTPIHMQGLDLYLLVTPPILQEHRDVVAYLRKRGFDVDVFRGSTRSRLSKGNFIIDTARARGIERAILWEFSDRLLDHRSRFRTLVEAIVAFQVKRSRRA